MSQLKQMLFAMAIQRAEISMQRNTFERLKFEALRSLGDEGRDALINCELYCA